MKPPSSPPSTAPLEIQELSGARAGPGQVLVRIEAPGCATPTSTPPAATGR